MAPPKVEQKQFIIENNEEAPLLMSTLKIRPNQSETDHYVPYCTGEILDKFLVACLRAKSYVNKNVNIVLVGGGDLYVSNVTGTITRTKTSTPGSEAFTYGIEPHAERVQFNEGKTLHPDATAGLQTDLAWLNDHQNSFIKAADAVYGKNEYNFKIIAPVINRNNKPAVTVSREVVYQSDVKDNLPTVTIDFYTWAKRPGLTPIEKSKRFAKAIAYYNQGRIDFQRNFTPENVRDDKISDFKSITPAGAQPTDIWAELDQLNINLFKLPDFKDKDDETNPYRKADKKQPNKNKDLEFLCIKHGIDYKQFLKDLADEKITAEQQSDNAKTVFENASMAASTHFGRFINGSIAKSLNSHRDKAKKPRPGSTNGEPIDQAQITQIHDDLKLKHNIFANELFLANVLIILVENAYLKEELYPKDVDDPTLKNIHKIGTALGYPINFKTKYRALEAETSISPASEEMAIKAKKENLLKDFTAHISDVIEQICTPEGFYNVPLALDMLHNILGWYIAILDAVLAEEVNNKTQTLYQAHDDSFWRSIHSITNRMSTQLAEKAKEHGYEKENNTLQKARLDKIKSAAISHFTNEKLEKVKPVFESRDTLNAWYNSVEGAQKHRDSKLTLTSAVAPEENQIEKYGDSIDKAHHAFTVLSVAKINNEAGASKASVMLEQLQRSCRTLEKAIVGSDSEFALRQKTKPYFK